MPAVVSEGSSGSSSGAVYRKTRRIRPVLIYTRPTASCDVREEIDSVPVLAIAISHDGRFGRRMQNGEQTKWSRRQTRLKLGCDQPPKPVWVKTASPRDSQYQHLGPGLHWQRVE